ncbi:UNVERIFIED_CONTAM: hypothetical protein Slati_1726600 [Sesamum latifolium]|uniref:Reverse transcriptase domain-containing protein n=1 Tax=Sesamum latifolium TaxID=2727402 RepID=A0AAW2WW53_9LAMI
MAFRGDKKRVQLLEGRLERLLQGHITPEVREDIEIIRKELESIVAHDEIVWRQRSKVLWLWEGDRNTGYFHRKYRITVSVCFVSGRLISDNIFLAFKLNHFLNSKTRGEQGWMALKLDVSKAYDKHAELEGSIRGIAVCRGAPTVSHLLFADDTLIFYQASPESARSIRAVLETYRGASGQEINFLKSSVAFSRNSKEDMCRAITAELTIRWENKMELYLGLPSRVSRSKRDLFATIRDSI